MTRPRETSSVWGPMGVLLAAAIVLWCAVPACAQDCGWLLGLFQQGLSTQEIAQGTGLTTVQVESCRRQLQQPIFVGPEGAPPHGAVGPAPRNPAGPPPGGAAGPPPAGAAGPPPVGHKIKRLP